jgi:hypothetical protein
MNSMEDTNTSYIRHKVEDSVYSQISYSGKIRWRQKEKGSLKLILQQEEITNIIENSVVTRTEVKWVDVPVEWIKD